MYALSLYGLCSIRNRYSIHPITKQLRTKPGSRSFPLFIEDLACLEIPDYIVVCPL